MNTPTGGSVREGGTVQRHAFSPRLLVTGCAAAALLLCAHVHAAESQLRVIGTLSIEASASRLRGGSELQARLLDDAGHSVSGAELQIKPLYSGAAVIARECQSRTEQLPVNASGAYLARSNGAGAVCVRFEGTPEGAEFDLTFIDPSGLYGTASRRVVSDSAVRNVQMAFVPAPNVLALEREIQVLSLLTRPVPPLDAADAVERLEVALSAKRAASTPTRLGVASVEIGSSAEFRIDSRLLGGPGPLEISAEFAGSNSTRSAHATARATATAVAELSLAEPLAANPPGSGVVLQVRVSSVAGRVPSGTVEARSAGLSLASSRVHAGLAELILRVDDNEAKARPIELRYVSDLPWWLPGSPLWVQIPILAARPWHRIAWIAAVAALGSWLLLGWQRPRRLERVSVSAERQNPVRAPVEVIEVGDARTGWRGRVIDAHDGTPIANAEVLMRWPSFETSGVLRSAQSDAEGAFVMDGIESAGPGAALEVRAPLHTSLVAPMPPWGTLLLSLTSRRRSLLARFVDWAGHEGALERRGEATPGELARRTERSEVAIWASAVDEAAFGPDPLSEAKEGAVVGREPPHQRKPPQKVDRG